MDRDSTDTDLQTSQEGDDGQTLVGKLKKNVTEIISNTPLSKWFRKQNDATPTSTVRRRQDDSEDEEDLQEFQPPTKRTKLPFTKETLSLNVSEVLSPISTVNNVKKPLYRNFPEPIAGPSGYQTRKMLNSTSVMSESTVRSTKLEGNENAFKNPKITAASFELINKEGNNSDSEESTSGYSSGRVGSKEIISQGSSKQTSPLEMSPKKNRSLFQSTSSSRLFSSERSLSPNRNSNLSSRMPSFNPSTFGSSSFVDRTLSTKRILNSPFYSGRTIYGGASAYGQRTRRATNDIQKVLRQSVSIKPTNRSVESGNLQLGKTARRILDTLEQYSSPVSDAKKIPIASKKHKSEGSLAKFVGANPYTLRETRSASNRELQVPSITDVMKAKMDQQKTRLQDSTEAVRQIATKSTSAIDNESYQIPVHRGNEKHTTKMKTKIASVRHKVVVEESVPEVKLNPISLPIKELPTFDISIPPPARSTTVTIGEPIPPGQLASMKKPVSESVPIKKSSPVKQQVPTSEPASIFSFEERVESEGVGKSKLSAPKTTGSKESVIQNDLEFKFSAPLVLAEYLKPLKALNNFKFSEPLVKKRKSIHPELDDQENRIIETNKAKKNNGANVSSETKATESKGDSIMEKFKLKEGVWECSVCLIRNQADKSKCVACENPQPKSKSVESVQVLGAPISLKPAESTWECPTCMIRNKENVLKCAACEEKKPEKSFSSGPSKVTAFTGLPVASTPNPSGMENLWECKSCSAQNAKLLSQCHHCLKPKSSDTFSNVGFSKPLETAAFGPKFALPPDTWECSTCMIRNKNELTKCAACESPKPSSKGQSNQNQSVPASSNFGAEFKKKDDEWECQVCMIRNKADATKCQCCESANPKPSTSASSATSPKVSTFNFGIDKNTATSFKFGIPPGLQSTSKASKTNAALVFGEKREESKSKVSEAQSFTFGVPPKDSTSVETKKEPSKASEKVDPPKSIPTFSSGTDSKTSEASSSKPAPMFSFGAAPRTTEPTSSKSTTNPSFSFGASPKATEATSTPMPTFSFGAPSEKSDVTPSKSTPVFSFGSASKSGSTSQAKSTPTFTFDTVKKTETLEQNTTTSTFSFGATRKSDATSSLGTTTPTFTFGSASQTDSKVKEDSKTGEVKFNPLLKPSEKLPEKAAVAPVGFSFGLTKPAAPINVPPTRTESSSETSPRKRSKPLDEDTASQAKIPTFSFKSPTTNGDLSKTASSFSKPTEENNSAAPVGGFTVNFGTGKTNVTANSATIVPTFGSNVSQADRSKPAAFKFGSSSETPKQANGFNFGSSAPTFGVTAPTTSTENKTFTFSNSAPTTQAQPPSFGATAAPTKVGMFSFGGLNQNKPATFSFNATNSENKTSSQFSFGSNTPKTQSSFAFNQSPAPSPASTFSFGSNQKTATDFGTGSTATNPFGAVESKPESIFGSAPNQSAALNGTFNFGSSATTNQKAGFSFGGSSSTSESGATQSGFNFGSSTMSTNAPTASGGFNFSGSAPTFDATAKPAFNFTGGAGIAAFSAPPAQDGTMPQRKIKKAVRRVR